MLQVQPMAPTVCQGACTLRIASRPAHTWRGHNNSLDPIDLGAGGQGQTSGGLVAAMTMTSAWSSNPSIGRPSTIVKVATGWVTQIVSRIHGLLTTDPPPGVVVVNWLPSRGKGAWPIGGPQRAR